MADLDEQVLNLLERVPENQRQAAAALLAQYGPRFFEMAQEDASQYLHRLMAGDLDVVAELDGKLSNDEWITKVNGLVRQSIQIEPGWVDESAADGLWNATVRYGLRPPPEMEEWTFSFDTTGGTQHVTQSIATVARYAPPMCTFRSFRCLDGPAGRN